MNPKVTDNDKGEITVSLDGNELRGWSYANDTERRTKMLCAHEYVEGWCDGKEAEQVAAAERHCRDVFGENVKFGGMP